MRSLGSHGAHPNPRGHPGGRFDEAAYSFTEPLIAIVGTDGTQSTLDLGS